MSTPTFFEGPEKKVELVVVEGHASLRSLGDVFWHEVVAAADAQVLSKLEGSACDAYLLSESSLFVYDGYLTMITCGQTRLVNAVRVILERIGADKVALLMYERKNEHFPDRQHSTFYDDATALRTLVPGEALRFGDEHDHHVHLFHTTAAYGVHAPDDTTLEILMHGLAPEVADRFVGASAKSGQTIANAHGFDDLLPGFAIDEHAFTPAGYSMNALRDSDHYTVHVTPEQLGSYVSFETNLDFRGRFREIVQGVTDIFQPRSFDVMAFTPADSAKLSLSLPGFQTKDRVLTRVHGYEIRFWHCFVPTSEAGEASPVPLG